MNMLQQTPLSFPVGGVQSSIRGAGRSRPRKPKRSWELIYVGDRRTLRELSLQEAIGGFHRIVPQSRAGVVVAGNA
jgi:hypothetical protein